MTLIYLAHIPLPNDRAHAYQILQMCEAFAQHGVPVKLLYAASLPPTPPPEEDIWEAYDLERVFVVEGVPSVSLAFLAGKLPGRVRRAWMRLSWMASLLTFSLAAAYRLRGEADSVLYSRDALLIGILAWLWPARAGRMFFEAHTTPASRAGIWLRRRLADQIGGFVMLTGHMRRRHEAIGVSPRVCLVAHDGVRTSRFSSEESRVSARSRLGWPTDAFIVGYSGRLRTLEMDKGVSMLARSVEQLNRESGGLSVRLAIVGRTERDIRQLRADLKREGAMEELVLRSGWVTPISLPSHLRAMDVCAVPMPWTEHFAFDASPLKLFEYMASGTPIVASDLPAICEVLVDGVNALLVPPSDIRAWADALRRLRDDPDLGVRLAHQAARDAQEFTWEKRSGRIIQMIGAIAP